MRKTKKLICLILCFAMSLTVLAGCGESKAPATDTTPPVSAPPSTPPPVVEAPSAAPEDVEFYEHLTMTSESIAVIDPFNSAFGSAWIAIVCHMIYNPLFYYTLEGTYEPALATDYETADAKTWNFTLRDDVYFHNGEHFTAADVKWTVEKAKESPGTQIHDIAKQVEEINIINDYEIEFVLMDINVDFIFSVSQAVFAIVNQKAYEEDPEKGPWVGTGPWVVTGFLSTQEIDFTRNENYWGELPITKTFKWIYVAEATSALIMLENGDVQLGGMSTTNVPIYENDPRIQLKSYVMNNCNYLAFNMNKPLMADKNFRLAVASAINRQELVDIALGGYGTAVDHGSMWGYRTEFKADDIPIIPYDLEKAKEYLELSSYNGETIELVAAMTHTIATAQVVQQQLSLIGINSEIFNTDPPTLSSYTAWGNTDTDIVVNSGAWSGLASSVRAYFYPGSNSNKANYDNPVMSELLDRARTIVDNKEREKVYREIQELFAEDIPYIATMHMGMYRAERAGVGGVQYFPNNNWNFAYAYMVKE